jgi:hypothetical protein
MMLSHPSVDFASPILCLCCMATQRLCYSITAGSLRERHAITWL